MPIPVIETPRLLLRPFVLSDAPIVQRLAGAPEVALNTANIPYPYEDGMAEEWISTHEGSWDERKLLALAITTQNDGVVGAVSLRLEFDHQRGELGYWVGIPYWNRGYATEASASLVALGFESLGLNRIQARHLPRNPASGRVMQKLGMQFEGVMRQHMLVRNKFEDLAMYAILLKDHRAT